VIVPDHQLSLAIGREGQNARLAARLTGVRVDIRSETQLAEGIPSGGRDEENVDYADGQWVANKETGEMEWHASDGSVISESAWQDQQAAEAAAQRQANRDAEDVATAAGESDGSEESKDAESGSDEIVADLPAGAHAPLGDPGDAPEGHPIKGNADSMKYHEPDGQWFDSAVAELWFDTAVSAESAGYTKAGSSD
jgi:hypothetical protein